MNSNWFARYTTSRHEKRVAEDLCQRNIEFFLPQYCSQRKWNNRSMVTLEPPLFPGYLFVRTERYECVAVLSVSGALAAVDGAGGESAALPDSTVDALRRVLELRATEPHPVMTAGQRARVHRGPLAGLEGDMLRSKGNFRVAITVAHIMESFQQEDLENLQPLPSNLT